MEQGDIVDGHYEIIAKLGDGGMGAVFKAREIELERDIALKLMHPGFITDHETLARFEREAKVLSQLIHPNVITFYRFGVWQKYTPYIAMEYVDGQSVRNLLDKTGKLSALTAIDLCTQICDALDTAHNIGIVHRDLKPSNIMLVDHGEEAMQVKILDFGLARVFKDDDVGLTQQHLTQTGELVGTVFYMSPEQCRGQKADHRSDIYSLGCVLYELVTGNPPFYAENPIAMMHLHVNEESPQLTSENAMPGLATVINRAMEKDPERRFQSMTDMKTQLQMVAQGKCADVPRNRVSTRTGTNKSLVFLLLLLLSSSTVAALVAANHSARLSLLKIKSDPVSDLGPSLPSRATIFVRYPEAGKRIDTLKRWIAKYGTRDPKAAAEAYYCLYFDLLSCGAPRDEIEQAAIKSIENFEIVLKHRDFDGDNIPPRLVQALLWEGEVETTRGNWPRAMKLYVSALDRWGDKLLIHDRWKIYRNICTISQKKGDYKLTDYYYKKILSEVPAQKLRTLALYAQYLMERGNDNAANTRMNEAILYSKSNPAEVTADTGKLISDLLRQQQRYLEALEFARQSISVSDASNSTGDRADARLIAAKCLTALKRYAEAREELTKAYRLSAGMAQWAILGNIIRNERIGKLKVNDEPFLNQTMLRSDTRDTLDGLLILSSMLAADAPDRSDQFVRMAAKKVGTFNDKEFLLYQELIITTAVNLTDRHLYNESRTFIAQLLERSNKAPLEQKTHMQVSYYRELSRIELLEGRLPQCRQYAEDAVKLAVTDKRSKDYSESLWTKANAYSRDSDHTPVARQCMKELVVNYGNLYLAHERATMYREYASMCLDPAEAGIWQRKADALLARNETSGK